MCLKRKRSKWLQRRGLDVSDVIERASFQTRKHLLEIDEEIDSCGKKVKSYSDWQDPKRQELCERIRTLRNEKETLLKPIFKDFKKKYRKALEMRKGEQQALLKLHTEDLATT